MRLGTAFVDQGRCLPWSMDTPCIVCQENCPISPKAIFIREAFVPIRDPLPPVGNYRCRTIKLGARDNGPGLAYVAYGWFNCKVERTPRGGMKLSKTTGSQRQTGLMFPDSERRGVFLGAMALGDEPPARAYGLNADRDVVGVVERIGAAHWRLVQPWPRYESNLDLLEIVPAG